MSSDLRHAVRALRAAPGFTAVALVILTLGIGMSTAIFSVVDAVVFRGLPFDEADRLVSVTQRATSTGLPTGSQAPQNFLDWRARQQVLEGIAAVTGGSGYVLRTSGQGREIQTRRVTHELFPLLRVAPVLGRTFSADEEVNGRDRVAVLSYTFWQRELGGRADVIGQTLPLDNGTYQVIGVMPPSFTYPLGLAEPSEMWVPFVVPASERVRSTNRSFYLQLVGRLKPGVSIEQAEAALALATAPIAEQYPDWFRDRTTTVIPLHEALVGRMRPWMLLLAGAVGCVLLLVCVNVANLMLARAAAREREAGIRAALGASRWRIARARLLESLLLSATGAALGMLVAWVGVDLLRAAMPGNVPRLAQMAIDWRVLAASAAAAIVTGLLCGVLPAFQGSRPHLAQALKEGGRSATAGVVKQRIRAALVMGEVALAVVLLVGAGLFMSSFARVMAIDVGLDPGRILTLGVPVGSLQRLSDLSETDRQALAARNRQLLFAVLERVQSVPGVEHAAILNGAMPLTPSSNTTSVRIPGSDREFTDRASAEIKRITPDYHAAVGVPLVAGRTFTPADREGTLPVVILNETAAALYFEGKRAVGQVLHIQNADRAVVGVVGGVRQNGPETPMRPEAYVPLGQATVFNGELVVRTSLAPSAVLPGIRQVITDVIPTAVFPAARTMAGLLDALVAQRRFNMLVFSLFGILGLVIAVAGVFGVLASVVDQRTAEFGVRMALGAQRASILAMVVRRAGVLILIGMTAGLAAAFLLSRLVATFLFEVQPRDPGIYAAVAVLLAGTGIVAALVPAWRASRVDPIIALRTQ